MATRENVFIDEPTKRNPGSELVTAGIKRFLPDEARVERKRCQEPRRPITADLGSLATAASEFGEAGGIALRIAARSPPPASA